MLKFKRKESKKKKFKELAIGDYFVWESDNTRLFIKVSEMCYYYIVGKRLYTVYHATFNEDSGRINMDIYVTGRDEEDVVQKVEIEDCTIEWRVAEC
jgi:hypothetical protein